MRIILATVFLIFLCSACEPAKPAAPVKPKTAPAQQTKKVNPEQQKKEEVQKRPNQSLRQEIQSAVDYGIGAAQLEAKKRATNRIENVREQHNKDLEDALK